MASKETPFIIECGTLEEANAVDHSEYRLSEDISAKRGIYIFLKRRKK